MHAIEAIRQRRTVKEFTGEALPRAELELLLEAAAWAPTHRQSEPWRFAVLERPAIAALAQFLISNAATLTAGDAKAAAKLPKQLGLIERLGALVIVTWVRDVDAMIDGEDRDAAAAAVQNLLIAATARGWGSFWSTAPILAHAQTLAWCGRDAQAEGFLAAVWLGRSAAPPPGGKRRPLSERATFVDAH